jgi:leader peptidase (prepilin peptidase)/N-methyltransferase
VATNHLFIAFELLFSLLLGLAVGSFLGCCIHRLPRRIFLLNPRRSFCPACQNPLSWQQNLPVVSWLLLRGRCAKCGARISPVYPIVEILAAALFVAAAWRFGLPVAIGIWVFGSLLLVAAFVDLEFLIIPDETSKGGALAGLLLSFLLPQLQGAGSPLIGIWRAVIGLAVGAGILWLARACGQMMFGRQKVKFEKATRFRFLSDYESEPEIIIENETIRFRDYLLRPSERIRIKACAASRNGEPVSDLQFTFFQDRLQMGTRTIPLSEVGKIEGELLSAELPREAMGLGDLKLMAAIGAFTGWPGALFSIPFASFLGLFYGLFLLLSRQRDRLSQIPFGPFLAAAALIWVFAGSQLWDWYVRLLG